jgi:hypothetical protein
MKQPLFSIPLVLPVTALLLCGLPAGAITFTNDTAISFNNTNYDGADVVVTNCTLTVDGLHSFASVQVVNGGNLTHTFAANGTLQNRRTITNEQQVLSVTNVATLSNASVVVSTILVQDLSGLVTYTNGADYLTDLDTNGLTTLLLTTNSAIPEGSTNLVSYDVLDTPVATGLSLVVTGDVFVAHGGTINVDGRGYDGALGPGAGPSSGSPMSGSGAGHGGYGGQSAALDGTGTVYGVLGQPADLGSGGGRGFGGVGGAGGGSIKLVVGGNLRIEGAVSANGANGLNNRSGGGSGGSIWLTCQDLSGAGVISANGGAGEPTEGGGGAGGRISLQYAANLFSGLSPARGGNGYTRGGAGTVYTRAHSQPTGQVLVDNGGRSGMGTSVTGPESVDLSAQGGAIIALSGSQTFGNLLVASNAWISLSNQEATVSVTGNATIQAGGGITSDGAGYAGGAGPGAGKSDSFAYTGGGGGYGGYGAAGGNYGTSVGGTTAYGGTPYGSVNSPRDMGSGGGSYYARGLGGSGGGAVHLSVNGLLLLDGRISAEGSPAITEGSGGGSGGSVWVTAGTLAGAGTISANGGLGNGFGLTGGGGGGGGRIAIQYGVYLFFGATSARGGSGAGWGGAGTIYTVANNQSYGQLLVDNGGQSGTNTSWSQLGTVDLTVKGGAVVTPPSSQTIGTLLVASNGWVSIANQAGGGIIADGKGNQGGVGPGAGKYVSTSSGYIGSGGGYGGYGAAGGAPAGFSAPGGNFYGSLTAPAEIGSGGGSYSTYAKGGAGGGAIRINVTGVLLVDGRISASGGPATTPSAGGGSGGAINLTAGTLAGSGVISADGGAGNSLGGGGGGGRIAIMYGGYDFAGVVSAYGGGGYAYGGAGTVYTKATSQSSGQVVADNGGQTGTNTPLTDPSTVNLWVRNGAVVATSSPQSIGNLLVASNGWVVIPSGQAGGQVKGNATIQAGGGIIADGMGYAGGAGAGAGKYYSTSYEYIGGGGGYGGYGASGGTTSAYGGSTYGSVTAPVDLGSGGGGYSGTSGPPAAGGAGGGAIRLSVTGTLQVDGRISARGLAGTGPSAGGGSGGSLYLTVGTLTGAGSIDASGGAGNALGGGGGGGRIGITYSVNTFAGLMSAGGGGGYARGGAGTIYTKASNQNGLVVVDNGGQAGTNTSWSATGILDVTVKGGALLSLSSAQTIGNLLVASNGWLSVAIPANTDIGLTVSGNATIQAGGGIIADGTGYPSGQGQGAGSYYSTSRGYVSGGGGNGGYGATSGGSPAARGGNTVGILMSPSIGSGGGSYSSRFVSGAGGGAIGLKVTGTLQVDGRISAAGGGGVSANAGGGSGGGIHLMVGTLAGEGVIAANGGAGNGLGGGGGGGRIVINYSTCTFSGLMSAYGGGGYAWGGAGTIFTKANNQPTGQVLVDNGGRAGTNTSWVSSGAIDLTVAGAAVVSPPAGSQTFGNLLIASNGWLSVSTQILTVASNATIRAGGGIIADSTGNPAGMGPGAGKYVSSSSGYIGSGGGYGGYGAASSALPEPPAYGGNTYGSVTSPVDLGSGGGTYSTYAIGGAGGGAVRLFVTGALQVDGLISAAGGPGITPSAGGGSGGTISLTAGTFAGSGRIAANGGAGNSLGGGGGGGRVALVYGVNNFAGLVSAYGGAGHAVGGAGTIYTKANNQSWGQVIADNGGQAGTNTTLGLASTGTIDLTVKNGAVLTPPGTLVFGTLLVASNGWLTASTGLPLSEFPTLTVTGNATIQAGGGIIADGLGNAGGSGPGAGRSYTTANNYIGGGGGYGGYGASGGGTTFAYGGIPYGSAASPTELGSGGGGGYVVMISGTPLAGGAGGGALKLNVTGTLQVDGRISARGLAGTGPSAGGGSGGSINLTVGTLAGSGVISADGGAGNALGGGGGGGRIAVSSKLASNFSGLMSAYGGSGYATGGAGTIYFPTYSSPTGVYGLVVVDNGGQTGTNTGWAGLGSGNDLTVGGGARFAPTGSQSIGNLVVASNGWVVLSSSQGSVQTLSIRGNALVQAGCGIIADGTGYPPGQGPGAGGYLGSSGGYVSGGGGNGGYGAASGGVYSTAGVGLHSALGGNTVGNLTVPGPGSGGGNYSTILSGGPGGGAIALNVTGTLQVDGRISVAGGAGVSANAGGGAGGGINLNVGTLAGSGVIAADGGAGNGLGGGGGGGRIAIVYTANAFSGLLTAYGGGGSAWGGAGTIYTKPSKQSWGQVLVDNGGRAGTNTSWLSAGTIDLTVMGGAIVSPPSQQTLGNLLIASNAWMRFSTQSLNVMSNATVQAGGGILGDGTGYVGGQGPGSGRLASYSPGYVGGGGGHGGLGAASGGSLIALGGSTYGSVTAPVDGGSGGGNYSPDLPGGAGGGVIRMNVTGALLVNGRLSANGGAGASQGSGGGSGGSVWLTAGTLAGAGIISANGGAGNELGGGGGGGCISVQYGVNAFDGLMSAYGGGGYATGGAGTVYLKANNQGMGQLVLDNGGQIGANTPITYLAPFDLTIRGGAVGYPLNTYLILSNLVINSSGSFTCGSPRTRLDVAVLRNATIDAGGFISADGQGYLTASGPGAGVSSNYTGSGAGYGGYGGASSAAAGGVTYGSAQQPVDYGSGGGRGWQGTTVGGEGGGVIRFTVGGALTVNGRLSADGNAALQDDGGGGSGGSIWLTAGALAGNGTIAADGGAGELYDGGGGGGGRIAIYTPLNVFGGVVSATGGDGLAPGQDGSIYYASLPAPAQVVSCTPTGVLNAAVSSLDVVFNTVVNPASVSAASVSLTAPGGVPVNGLSVVALSPYSFRFYFPEQTALGNYAIKVGPQIPDLFGQPMSQVYTSAFSIVWSLVQGTVTDTNGLPVAGVVLQPDGGIPSTTTDTNGSYALSLPPGGTIVVTPAATNLVFVPGSRTYFNVTGTVSNENYLAVSTIIPAVAMQVQTNTCVLSWNGIAGVAYQPLYSTNLVDWLPYGDALPGTNGPIQFVMPIDTAPQLFFRVGASY